MTDEFKKLQTEEQILFEQRALGKMAPLKPSKPKGNIEMKNSLLNQVLFVAVFHGI